MRGYDPADGACDGDATLVECSECGDPYDAANYEVCPVCDQGPAKVAPEPESGNGPIFMETGVDHCPESRLGCGGPDLPWPCNHCQGLSDQANGVERAKTVEVPVMPMADLVYGEGAGL